MTKLSDDPWIAAHSPIEPERIYALGLITIYWNQCEYQTFHLFCDVTGLRWDECWALIHDAGDVARWTKIKILAEIKGLDPNILNALNDASQVYDICRKNRNQVTHFGIQPDFENRTRLLIQRIPKRPTFDMWEDFANDLASLRRVAEEIKTLNNHLWALTQAIGQWESGKQIALPDKLPPPVLLWNPLPQSPTGR